MRTQILPAILLLVSSAVAIGHPHKAEENTEAPEAIVASPGKPQHPIQVQLERAPRLQAGVPSDVELRITSTVAVEKLAVDLQAGSGMMLSQTHFERASGALRDNALNVPFKLTPSSDRDQQLGVTIRATMPDGRVMTRELQMSLDKPAKPQQPTAQRKHAERPARIVPPSTEDVVVPARQDVRKQDDDGK